MRSWDETILARQRQALALRKNGQLAEAEAQLRVLAADLADLAGADHAATLAASATHAAVLNDLGQHRRTALRHLGAAAGPDISSLCGSRRFYPRRTHD